MTRRRYEPKSCAVFVTGMVDMTSGGDIHAIRFAEHWAESRGPAYIIGPPAIQQLLRPGSRAELISPWVPLERALSASFAAYPALCAVRTLIYAAAAPQVDWTVAASHFLSDVAASVLGSRRANRAVYVHHIIAQQSRKRGFRSTASIIQERLSLSLLRLFTTIFVCDPRAAAWLTDRLGPGRLATTGNGCDPPTLPPMSKDRSSAIFLGRLTEEKGATEFVRIANLMNRRRPGIQFHIIGMGPCRAEMEDLATDAGLRCTFHGFVQEAEKWKLLAESGVFIAPSHEEGWGIAVDEALAAGTDVVCYALEAYDRLGSAVHGVPIGDLELAARAALEVLDGLAGEARHAPQHPGATSWSTVLGHEIEAMLSQAGERNLERMSWLRAP